MSDKPIKNYPTLGCCGLDCGLCPRYYITGSSRCTGCAGPDFFNKHPSCSYISCCIKKKGLEVCSQCSEFPCGKFESWLETGGEYDSFLTHKKAKPNQEFIKKNGLEKFLEQQRKRIELLNKMLRDFDDGRSRSYYCIAASLLSVSDLEISLIKVKQKIEVDKVNFDDRKGKSKILKELLNECATRNDVELRLRRKPAS